MNTKGILLVGIQFTLIFFILFIVFSQQDPFFHFGTNFLSVTGYVFVALGISISLYSAVYMGRLLTPLPTPKKDHTLITSGPFKLVRHPIYCGLLLTVIGFFIETSNSIIGCLTILLAILLHFKMNYEEEFLLKKYGESYKAYQYQVKRILPFMY